MPGYPVRDGAGNIIIPERPVANAQFVTGAGASAVNVDLLTGTLNGWYDVGDAKYISVQLRGGVGISAGAVIFEQTNDVAAAAIPLRVTEDVAPYTPVTGALIIAASASRLFNVNLSAKYIRVRVSTAFVGGTVNAIAQLGSVAPSQTTVATQSFAANLKSESVGPVAHDGVVSGNPNRIAARALTANYTPVASGDVADLVTTTVGAVITKDYSIPELDWSYAPPAGGIVVATDVVAAAAPAAGLRRYITSMQVRNAGATATEFVVKDGPTVIWRGHLAAGGNPQDIVFTSPLRGSPAAAINVQCVTAVATPGVLANLQGYVAP